MLDQSFSAHNLEVIFDLENRKGNIDINWMPEGYRVAAVEMKELRYQIGELKSKGRKKTEEDVERIKALEQAYKKQKDKKEEFRQAFLKDCEVKINSKDFKFTMTKYLDEEADKEVFKLNAEEPTVFFAMKQLQYNIHKTFKVKQANRHAILCDVKALLHTMMPLHIIRTDISGFYESIPQTVLLEKVEGNTLLSYKSKAFIRALLKIYDDCKDETKVAKGLGVPRGVGISPLLSEIYVRDLDSHIKSCIGTQFYARYVDDIFIILTILPEGQKDAKDYFASLQVMFEKHGLTLKDETDPKKKCKLLDVIKDETFEPFDYLGYSISIKREKKLTKATFGLSENKIKHFKEKVDHIVAHFENKSKNNFKEAYKDLFDLLNYITGNTKLFKSKAGVKVGLFYNNDLLDKKEDLDTLQQYLRDKEIEPSHNATGWTICKTKIANKIEHINLRDRWEQKKMFHFSLARIQEMEAWL
ncbi:MAG: hypothetical protein J6T22_06610 [Bacteroidales bacterium]|nr:hypothetical protein [Bacteroidales bacterium]